MNIQQTFNLRGRVLRALADFFRAPGNQDGTLFMSAPNITRAVHADEEDVKKLCESLVGEQLVKHGSHGYRLSHDWLWKRALEQQDREVVDIALTTKDFW